MGTPAASDWIALFCPQCVRNHPVAAWFRIICCGTHGFTSPIPESFAFCFTSSGTSIIDDACAMICSGIKTGAPPVDANTYEWNVLLDQYVQHGPQLLGLVHPNERSEGYLVDFSRRMPPSGRTTHVYQRVLSILLQRHV